MGYTTEVYCNSETLFFIKLYGGYRCVVGEGGVGGITICIPERFGLFSLLHCCSLRVMYAPYMLQVQQSTRRTVAVCYSSIEVILTKRIPGNAFRYIMEV